MVNVVYEDEVLVAVFKPYGVLTHASKIDKCSSNIQDLVNDISGRFLYPVHRLDRPTSGLLLFAKTGRAAAELAASLRNRQVKKFYIALVRGWVACDSISEPMIVDKPLKSLKHSDGRLQSASSQVYCLGKCVYGSLAHLSPHNLSTTRYSLCLISPITGRQHQIRRHLKSMGHPIVGDTRYGKGDQNRFFRNHFNSDRLLLHSYGVFFIHPKTHRRIYISCEIDMQFSDIIKSLELAFDERFLNKRIERYCYSG